MGASEVRVVDPRTGGEKGQKRARFDLIPWKQLWEVAEHYGAGAEKYDDRNWERGYRWSLAFGALHRHLALFWGGESRDSETGTHHLAAVVFHALALMYFEEVHADLDDRPLPVRSAPEREAAEAAGGPSLACAACARRPPGVKCVFCRPRPEGDGLAELAAQGVIFP